MIESKQAATKTDAVITKLPWFPPFLDGKKIRAAETVFKRVK